jgi:hypothetical protein
LGITVTHLQIGPEIAGVAMPFYPKFIRTGRSAPSITKS